ncbi:MAG TPA: hypothetical protein VNO51_09385 [Ilumatobacteraceae bacterium]|nr:hypothetical protein [Ilumatobacteraceae bacterium]
MIRTQISMTEAQAEALRRVAATRRISQAAVLRDALDIVAANEEQARRIDRARRALGSFSSGFADTSAEHDAVLDDVFSQ